MAASENPGYIPAWMTMPAPSPAASRPAGLAPFTGGCVPLEINMDALLPGAMAARLAGVRRQVIGHWKTRGYLPVAGKDAKGRPLYRVRDILAAEAATAERCETRAGRTAKRNPAGIAA